MVQHKMNCINCVCSLPDVTEPVQKVATDLVYSRERDLLLRLKLCK